MSRRPYRPKRWPAPKSKRTREDVAWKAIGLNTLQASAITLRSLYTKPGSNDSGRKPAWVELSYERGWMTFARYLMEPNEPGLSPLERMYSEGYPVFGFRFKGWAT